MSLNSFIFWIIYPLLFSAYWLIPSQLGGGDRKFYLLLVSYLLYLSVNPYFAIVLFYITIVTYYGAKLINNSREDGSHRILILVLGISTVFPLALFKYYNFINEWVTRALSAVGLDFNFPGLNWAVPLGISFYTFQALGYLFDVYYKKVQPETKFGDYALFCSFFPQLASGPISTAAELLPQIKSEKKFVFSHGVQGLKWVLWGIVLKCVVADRIGLFVDTVFNNYQYYSGLNCLWASILFSIQIYADFAGYSLMAIGVAKTLGFDLINNFNRPYFAESITFFWKRWHISLTRWLTQYVYIPLGGNRRSKGREYSNILVTFLVSGLWHGANVTFIVWGGIHGLLQIAEKAIGLDPKGRLNKKPWILKAKPLRIVITFLLVTLAWIFFRMPTVGDAVNVIVKIFTDHTVQPFMYKATNADKVLTFFALLLLLAADLRAEYLTDKLRFLNSSWARWLIYISLFCIVLGFGVLDSGSFIYANF